MSLEERIEYQFSDSQLLERALTHPSYRYETAGVDRDNQRLEFLGDAVIDLLSAAALFDLYPTAAEGDLSKLRSACTSDKMLAEIGANLDLGPLLYLGCGEEQSGGNRRPSNLADAVEALFGAIYLDGGLDAAASVFHRLFDLSDQWQERALTVENPKGTLLEFSQRTLESLPVYTCIGERGPPHHKQFDVEVHLTDGSKAIATGTSKRRAEARAAQQLLQQLGLAAEVESDHAS